MSGKPEFSVDFSDGTLRYVNGVNCGKIIKEVDGYYVWYPKQDGGCWESAFLRKIADLLDGLNKEWDDQIRAYFDDQKEKDPECSKTVE